jgi:hypothetical protein
MTDAHDVPNLNDVMDTTEEAFPDRREHAKAKPHPDDDELERRTEEEREAVGLEESGPGHGPASG